MLGSKTRHCALPCSLAMYIATSALRSSCSASSGRARVARTRCRCSRARTTSRPSNTNGCSQQLVDRRQAVATASPSGDASSRIANSSPPTRAIVSARRGSQDASRRADGREQPVARDVPEAVVDRLEVVEVEEEHGDRRCRRVVPLERVHGAACRRARGSRGPSSASWNAWWESCSSNCLPLAHVADVDHVAADARVAHQIGDQRLDVERAAVPAGELERRSAASGPSASRGAATIARGSGVTLEGIISSERRRPVTSSAVRPSTRSTAGLT